MLIKQMNAHQGLANHREQTFSGISNGPRRSTILSRSILLVDDEPQTRDLLRLMLKRDGYDVFEAEDGFDALKKVKALIPDMVLLDVMMPDIDGIAVCQKIRADQATSKIPVVMLSARTHMEAVKKGIIAGATRYLTKPIGRKELLQHVSEVFDGVPSAEAQLIREQFVGR